jgi:hypothetical protein
LSSAESAPEGKTQRYQNNRNACALPKVDGGIEAINVPVTKAGVVGSSRQSNLRLTNDYNCCHPCEKRRITQHLREILKKTFARKLRRTHVGAAFATTSGRVVIHSSAISAGLHTQSHVTSFLNKSAR